MKKIVVCFCLFMVVALGAAAQPGSMMGGGMMGRPGMGPGNGAPFGIPITVDDTPLTDAQVKAFIAFHQKIQTLTPAERESMKSCTDYASTAANPVCMKVRGWWEASGLKNEEETKATSWKVIRAYVHVTKPEEMKQMMANEKQLQTQMKDPSTPEMAKGFIKQGLDMMQKMKCPEADVKLVGTHKSEISAIMDTYEKWNK